GCSLPPLPRFWFCQQSSPRSGARRVSLLRRSIQRTRPVHITARKRWAITIRRLRTRREYHDEVTRTPADALRRHAGTSQASGSLSSSRVTGSGSASDALGRWVRFDATSQRTIDEASDAFRERRSPCREGENGAPGAPDDPQDH